MTLRSETTTVLYRNLEIPQPDLANAVRVAENLLQAIKDRQRPQLPASQPGGAWARSRLGGPTTRSAFSTPVVSVMTSGHSEKV